MADQPKRKNPNAVTRNEGRANGKASKGDPNATFRGKSEFRGSHTRHVSLSEVQKVNMGRGILSSFRQMSKEEADNYFVTKMGSRSLT
jgi:hypothetical protein